MDCLHNNQQGADLLVQHLSGTLDPARAAELERHEQECPDCRALLAVWNRLDDLPAPAVSEDFDTRLYARIAEETRLPWWRRMWLPTASRWRPMWRPALPAAAAACAVVVLALFIHDPDAVDPVTDDAAKQARIEPNGTGDVEQMVQALDDLELLSPVSPGSAGAI